MKVYVRSGQTVMAGHIDDTPAGRDFCALLPLTLTVQDYANAEKIADLPKPLSLARAPKGSSAEPGDIAYYAPWGNIALFYQSAAFAPGLVKLGRLTTDFDILSCSHELTLEIGVWE